jgi:hypothetical protein
MADDTTTRTTLASVGGTGAAARLALVAALALPCVVGAQAPEPSRLVAGVTTVPAAVIAPAPAPATADADPAASPALQPPAVPKRHAGLQILGGVVGAYGGALGGALLGTAVLPRTQCGDDPGLCEAVPGAIVGTVVGSAIGAALPSGGERCGFGRRALYGIGGGVLGFAAGVGAAAVVPASGLVTVPVGTGIGSGLAAWVCG